MNNDENIISVLMSIFKNHIQKEPPAQLDESLMIYQLKQSGFSLDSIHDALAWLKPLQNSADYALWQKPSKNSIRMYTDEEKSCLSPQSRGFLAELLAQDVIPLQAHEIIIDRLMDLDLEIDLGLVKWVTLIVLFCLPLQKNALAYIEMLNLEETLEIGQ